MSSKKPKPPPRRPQSEPPTAPLSREDETEEPTVDVTDTAVAESEKEEAPDLDPSGLPSSATDETEEPTVDVTADPPDASLRHYVILDGPASYGPVLIGGAPVRCKRGVLYLVPDAEERADILASGRFRGATKKDEVRAGQPSAGPGGAITRDLLPPGALRKGGL